MENIRAIQELLEDAEIPEGIYLKVCGHLKKAHDALMSKGSKPLQHTGATQRQCWRCFEFYPDRCRELIRRVAGISEEDAALLTTEQMRTMTGFPDPQLEVEMYRQMCMRNDEITAERRAARANA